MMVRAFVGSGGKTTLLKQQAKAYRALGCSVFVTTTTHMYVEDNTLLTDDPDKIVRALRENGYVMAGTPLGRKMGPLSKETYETVCLEADVVLVEADGSRHMPLKFPAENEPAIPCNAEETVIVVGLHGLGKPAGQVCHRLEQVLRCLNVSDNTPITMAHIKKLVREGYFLPLGRKYPNMRLSVVANRNGIFEAWEFQ